ncbi:TPA: hypothetical protein MBI04_003573 [Klebsiella pneumoniae]|nr:hypothetical protein [Klebsiella pneumoniae]
MYIDLGSIFTALLIGAVCVGCIYAVIYGIGFAQCLFSKLFKQKENKLTSELYSVNSDITHTLSPVLKELAQNVLKTGDLSEGSREALENIISANSNGKLVDAADDFLFDMDLVERF